MDEIQVCNIIVLSRDAFVLVLRPDWQPHQSKHELNMERDIHTSSFERECKQGSQAQPKMSLVEGP